MSRRTLLLALVVVAVVAVAAVAYAFFKTPEEASAPIEAIPVLVETAPPVAQVVEPTVAATATAQPAEPTPAPDPTVSDSAPAAAEAGSGDGEAAVEPEVATEPAPPSEPQIFEIVQAQSEARFIIQEVLRGSPKTVIGVTDQVAGQIAVDAADPAAARMGTIQVNARTLMTDSDARNRALKNRILQTNTYEFVTFTPSQLIGLPGSVTVGQPFSFQIVGDLTVRDKTLPVTFEATVNPVSETRLEGLATTNFLYADFGLIIPDAPAVNSVEDDVTLELQFVAEPVS